MSETKSSRKKFALRTGDRIVLIALLVLAVLTLIVNLLNAAGLRLVAGAVYLILPLTLLLVALGWGFSALVRRIRRPVPRKVVGWVLAALMLVIGMLAMQYGGFIAGLTMPRRYAVMTSPSGTRLIVMRALDPDRDRMDARRAARLAADPSGDPEFDISDWGYVYTAYAPGPLGWFYRPDTLIEGAVNIGYASAGELMLEWEEADTVGHFFIKNPEANDSGEMRARAA